MMRRRPNLGLSMAMGGGGAAPAAWTPADLGAKLTLDLRGGAANLTQVAGPKVSGWTDRSPLVHSFAQAVDATRPPTGAINSLACPDCTGSTYLDCAALGSTFIGASGSEFWIVAAFDTFPNSVVFGDATATEWLLRTITTGVQARFADAGGLDSTGVISLVAGTSYAIGVRHDGVTLTLEAAGTTQSVACGALASRANAVRIGSGVDGREGALVCCNAMLSVGERASLKSYLASTYGATL